jgi:hypothetical protein
LQFATSSCNNYFTAAPPGHAPSMRAKATILAPLSTTKTFINVFNCFAFSLAA